MSKITEAKTILAALQLRIAQQTEMAALTLLVMAQLDHETPWTPWSDTKRKSLRIHDRNPDETGLATNTSLKLLLHMDLSLQNGELRLMIC